MGGAPARPNAQRDALNPNAAIWLGSGVVVVNEVQALDGGRPRHITSLVVPGPSLLVAMPELLRGSSVIAI
jgi:hypothetical protein